MQPIRQGDVILLPVQQSDRQNLSHLTLAEGKLTGHKHRISEEQAELSEKDGTLYLRVVSKDGFINVLRIPLDMHSAREAIRRVNWETEPEEFSIQT
jgi:hypothetical protein